MDELGRKIDQKFIETQDMIQAMCKQLVDKDS